MLCTTTLLVVGGTTHTADVDMKRVVDQASQHPSPGRQVLVSSRDQLGAQVAMFGTGSISLLDIFFHGSPGRITLGRSPTQDLEELFASDDDEKTPLYGKDIARILRDHLTPTAHVRLLGCRTAVGRRGRLLLYKLAKELGERRVVFGTIGNLELQHFKQGRFDCEELLFSSLGAIDGEAPDWHGRILSEPRYPINPTA